MSSIGFQALTPVAFLERAAAVFGDRTAVVDDDISYSYADFLRRARSLAGLLREFGVGAGDRVAVVAPNTHVLLEAHFGVPMAGAVLVAINTRLSRQEVEYIIDHSGATVIVVDDEYAHLLEGLPDHGSGGPRIVSSGAYDVLIDRAEPFACVIGDEQSLLSINYTSGTTGRPKGVMYHHRGAYLQSLAMAYHARLGLSTRYLWTLPMFHTNGWCFPWAVTAAGGLHRCQRRVDPGQIWERIRSEGITHLCAAPTVLASLAAHEDASVCPDGLTVLTGGAPPWPRLLARVAELGIEVEHLYGLTETFGPVVVCIPAPEWAAMPAEERAARVARQGVANIIAEPVRLLDSDGRQLPRDGVSLGEIVLRGNDVMLGYYRDEEATRAAVLDGGWFRSGDLGVIHPDGYLEIRDRIKDVIVSGGENITSVEVETALTSHVAVLEAAVVGESHPKWGEVPVAFVSLKSEAAVTESELIAHVKGRIARFKAPHRIVFGDLPRTSTGKVQKNVLRRRHGELARATTQQGQPVPPAGNS